MNFEEKMKRLESLVAFMEDGKASLDDLIKAYEEGRSLADQCAKDLDSIRLKIEKVTKAGTVEALELSAQPATGAQ